MQVSATFLERKLVRTNFSTRTKTLGAAGAEQRLLIAGNHANMPADGSDIPLMIGRGRNEPVKATSKLCKGYEVAKVPGAGAERRSQGGAGRGAKVPGQ